MLQNLFGCIFCFFLPFSLIAEPCLRKVLPEPPSFEGFNMATVFDEGELGGFAATSILLWQANSETLLPAIVKSLEGSKQDIETISLLPSYHFGTKLLGGYRFLHGDWQVGFAYTYFRSKNSSKESKTSGEIIPLWSHAKEMHSPFTTQTSYWKLHNHIFDLHLSRRFYVGKVLIISSQAGVRSSLLQQKYQATYQNSSTKLDSKSSANAWSFGPRIGVLSDWFLGSGVRFFGKAAGTLAYTSCLLEHKEKASLGSFIFQIQDDRRRISPTTEMGAGLGWGAAFLDYTFHVDVSLSYDIMILFGRNFLLPFLQPFVKNFTTKTNHISLHGFTLEMRGDF